MLFDNKTALLNSYSSKKVHFYYLLIYGLFSLCLMLSCGFEKELPVIQSMGNQATIMIEGTAQPSSWTIVPEARPDVLPVEVERGSTKTVLFKTDIDSIRLEIGYREQKDFVVLVNGTDSAFTRVQWVKPKAEFSEAYIQENRGTWSIEVPEVKELVMIGMIITPTGLADTRSFIVNHDSTEYYLEVLDHFLPYKDEPIIAVLDSLMQRNWFINLKADAVAYEFDQNNDIVNSPTYDRMRGASNLLAPYLDLLTDFARKSNFRSFYENHQTFYDSLIEWHDEAISTKDQWDWLEQQFPDHRYDHYRITFSPLVKGNHSTVRFNQNGFKQAVMFIRPPYRVSNTSESISNGLITRFVFTEIDHNYVNPETDAYIPEVNRAFADREFWTNGRESSGYRSPYTIFNEYMTWSVYLLYIRDQYPADDFEVINDRIANYKISRRGFHKFKEFNDTLHALYTQREPGTTVASLYPDLLKWAEAFSTQ